MSAAASSEYWRFAGLAGPFLVRSEVALAPHRDRFLGTWPMEEAEASDHTDLELIASARGWRVTTSLLAPVEAGEIVHATAHAAVQGLSGALAACAVRQDAACLGLHCSAVELDGGLVLLPGASLSGKSTLAVQLAARGARLFGDDRLVLKFDENGIEGVALGLTPKLRLPLPAQAGPHYRAFIENRLLLTAVDVAYIRPGADEIAPFGTARPIRALVLPQRRDGARAKPEQARRDAVFRTLLDTVYAPHVEQPVLFSRLDELSRVTSCKLPFESSAAAADALAFWLRAEIGSDAPQR